MGTISGRWIVAAVAGASLALGLAFSAGSGWNGAVAIPFAPILLPMLGVGRGAARRVIPFPPRPAEPSRPTEGWPVPSTDRLMGPVLEKAGAGVWTVDTDLRITSIRGAIVRHLRLDPEAMVGSSLQELVDRHRGDLRLNWVHRVALAGTRESLRVRWAGRAWDVSVEPLHEGGRVVGAVAVSVDVTAEVEKDLELQEREAEARQLQARSSHAQRLEAAGRIASGLAHEVNNALVVVLAEVQQLRDRLRVEGGAAPGGEGPSPGEDGSEGDGDVRGTVQAMEDAAVRAVEQTRGFLTLSRRDACSCQLVDLNGLVRDVAGFLGRSLGPGVQLLEDLGADVPPVEGDPTQLQQVVVNLVLNARDAMPGGGRVELRTRRSEGRVLLDVVDEGCGMTPEEVEHAFEPYFTTKSPGEGTGLGLSLVRDIARSAGGGVEVETAPGEGSRFRVRLPASPGEGDASDDLAEVAPGEVAEEVRNGDRFYPSRTVLLVDDDTSVLRAARRLLEAEGHRVLEASSGPEALRVCGTWPHPPDLVLADVNMPGMDGRTLAVELERRWPGLPVLFTSGDGDGNGERRPHSFIAKPFPPRTFARKVREALLRGEVH